MNLKAEACERNGFLAFSILFHDDDFRLFEHVLERNRRSLAVFNCNCLRLLSNILIGRSLRHGVFAGNQTCELNLAVFIGLCCLIEVITGYSEWFSIALTMEL